MATVELVLSREEEVEEVDFQLGKTDSYALYEPEMMEELMNSNDVSNSINYCTLVRAELEGRV